MLLPLEMRALVQTWVQFKGEIPVLYNTKPPFFFFPSDHAFWRSWEWRDQYLAWWKKTLAIQTCHVTSSVKMRGQEAWQNQNAYFPLNLEWTGWYVEYQKKLGAEGRFVEVKQEAPILSVSCHLQSLEVVYQCSWYIFITAVTLCPVSSNSAVSGRCSICIHFQPK